MTNTHLHNYVETSRNWLRPSKPGRPWYEVIAYRCDRPGCKKPHKTVKGRRQQYAPEGYRDSE